jgi:hypothetical protein
MHPADSLSRMAQVGGSWGAYLGVTYGGVSSHLRINSAGYFGAMAALSSDPSLTHNNEAFQVSNEFFIFPIPFPPATQASKVENPKLEKSRAATPDA